MQYWSRKMVPVTNSPDIETLRRFKVGNLFHAFAESFFEDAQKEVKVEEEDVVGYLDIELSDRIVDIKTIRSYQFKVMKEKGYSIYDDNLPYVLQIAYYMKARGKALGEIVFIDKDAMETAEVLIEASRAVPIVEEELAILRNIWKADILPPPLPRAYGMQECKYCNYKDKCYQLEGREICPQKTPSVRSKKQGSAVKSARGGVKEKSVVQ